MSDPKKVQAIKAILLEHEYRKRIALLRSAFNAALDAATTVDEAEISKLAAELVKP